MLHAGSSCSLFHHHVSYRRTNHNPLLRQTVESLDLNNASAVNCLFLIIFLILTYSVRLSRTFVLSLWLVLLSLAAACLFQKS